MSEDPRCGWISKFPRFRATPPHRIRESLSAYVKDAGPKQVRAWDESIPPLQNEVGEILDTDRASPDYSTILEYTLPMESRRTDVIFLAKGSVVVLELKGKQRKLLREQGCAFGQGYLFAPALPPEEFEQRR